jgi:hypothetical protein
MIRFAMIALVSLVASTSHAETAGSYSRCNKLGANAGACTACLRSGQFYNFDTTRKQWVCGNTTGMKPSKPGPKSTKPSVAKPLHRPSSMKKR